MIGYFNNRIIILGFQCYTNPLILTCVTNSIVHAYRGGVPGPIAITVRLLPGGVIYIRITDRGCGIADIAQAMTPLYSSAPAEERAGLGFTVMQSFTDKLTVTSRPGHGTTVVMRKKMQHGTEQQIAGCS